MGDETECVTARRRGISFDNTEPSIPWEREERFCGRLLHESVAQDHHLSTGGRDGHLRLRQESARKCPVGGEYVSRGQGPALGGRFPCRGCRPGPIPAKTARRRREA